MSATCCARREKANLSKKWPILNPKYYALNPFMLARGVQVYLLVNTDCSTCFQINPLIFETVNFRPSPQGSIMLSQSCSLLYGRAQIRGAHFCRVRMQGNLLWQPILPHSEETNANAYQARPSS